MVPNTNGRKEIARDNLVNSYPSTRDFIDHLMMFMRPCQAHQAERASSRDHSRNSGGGGGPSRRFREDFKFSTEQYQETWLNLSNKTTLPCGRLISLSELTEEDDVIAEQIKKSSRFVGHLVRSVWMSLESVLLVHSSVPSIPTND